MGVRWDGNRLRTAGTQSAELSQNNVVFLATQNCFSSDNIIIFIIIKCLLQKTVITIRITILTVMSTLTLGAGINFKTKCQNEKERNESWFVLCDVTELRFGCPAGVGPRTARSGMMCCLGRRSGLNLTLAPAVNTLGLCWFLCEAGLQVRA